MKARVQRFCPEVAAKMSLIPSWADPERIKPLAKAENPFVQEHGLDDCFTVLYSGNQGRCHDLVTLMAAALLLRHDRRIRFLFIGSGPQQGRLTDLVSDWGLPNCTFLPYQDLEVLPYSLTSADLAVVSLGIDAEGLVAPSKLYGHLAAGTPIAAITPQGSELQQLVRTSGCGAWFANGDADGLADWIRKLVDHPEQARRHGLAGRELLLAEATPELVTNQYLGLIRRHLPFKKLAAIEDTRRSDMVAFYEAQGSSYPKLANVAPPPRQKIHPNLLHMLRNALPVGRAGKGGEPDMVPSPPLTPEAVEFVLQVLGRVNATGGVDATGGADQNLSQEKLEVIK
jgi:hypothetical protein